jgi:hypothetical protein
MNAMSDMLAIDRDLRRLTGECATARPFMCNGSPFGCEVALIGLNPGTTTPFWPYWNPATGFDRAGWMANHRSLHEGKRTPTRDRIEVLVAQLEPLRVIELNLYPFASRGESDLRPEQRDPSLLEHLLETLQPRVVIVHGRAPTEHLSMLLRTSLPPDVLTACELGGRAVDVYVMHKHLAYISGGESYLRGVATQIRQHLLPEHPGATSVVPSFKPEEHATRLLPDGSGMARARGTAMNQQRDDVELAWEKLKNADVTLGRWTSEGDTGLPFTFSIQSRRDNGSILFFRDGREVKSASYERFAEFYARWLAGDRTPDSYRNGGVKGSKAQVIHFLFPVFKWLQDQQPGVLTDAPDAQPASTHLSADTLSTSPSSLHAPASGLGRFLSAIAKVWRALCSAARTGSRSPW